MIVYSSLMFVVWLFGTLEFQQRRQYYLHQSVNMEQLSEMNKTNGWFTMLFFVFVFVGGFRYRVGTDYFAYALRYYEQPSEIAHRFFTLQEPIIYLITYVARSIWDNGALVIFLESLITIALVFRGLKTYTCQSYVMPLMLYILYCGFTTSFNGIRQSLAVAVIFAFSQDLTGKHFILKTCVLSFVAFLIHRSAILMLPVLVVANRKVNFSQICLMVVCAFSLSFAGRFAIAFMGNTMETEYSQHGVNYLRVIVACAPVILLLFTNRKYREENNFLMNMAVLNALIVFSTRNSALMFRFSDYTKVYLMVFIPKCMLLFRGSTRKILEILIVALFFAFFYVEVKSGNGGLSQFSWVFGHINELSYRY